MNLLSITKDEDKLNTSLNNNSSSLNFTQNMIFSLLIKYYLPTCFFV